MSQAIDHLIAAQQQAMSIRPNVGGFPYLAEALRQAGITKNYWYLPSLQSIYHTPYGNVVQQGTPLVQGMADIAAFNKEALMTAITTDQAGKSTFPEFLTAIWHAGVVSYEVDFVLRSVTYFGATNEQYKETYPDVQI